MNEQANEHVVRAIQALDAAQIPHMLVGAFSSNTYGIERSTKDADFVIELGDRSIVPVADALMPDFSLDRQISFESVTLISKYEARHVVTGFMIEFFLLADEAFHRERFSRRRPFPFGPVTAYLPTAEDVIVQKLRWYGRKKRTKDLDDAKDVTNVQSRNLDLAYIRRWCDQHGTREQFEQLYEESKQFEQES
ncbi:MAG: hypothetical protein IAG10_19700 [Planctomycetaceae bacterium]|nr:hypothetical protein [Planctomycetaceae bacterium]